MKKRTSFVLLLTVFLVGCTHYLYVPNVQNVPLFREKNELHISGEVGVASDKTPIWGQGESSCTDLQAAYSLTNHVGVQLNYMSVQLNNIQQASGLNNNSIKGDYIESAIGHFSPIGKHGVFELYGGLGLSDQHHVYANAKGNLAGTADLSFTKLFLQPAIGLTYNSFDIAVSTRIYNLHYDNLYSSNSDIASFENFNALLARDHIFLEPALTIRFGWRVMKFQLQYVYANNLNAPFLNFYEKSHISLGMGMIIGGTDRKEDQDR